MENVGEPTERFFKLKITRHNCFAWGQVIAFSVLKIRRDSKKTPCNVFLMFVLTFGAGGGAFFEDFLDLFGISSSSTALACLFTTKPDFLFLSDAFFFAFSAGKDWNQMRILFSAKIKTNLNLSLGPLLVQDFCLAGQGRSRDIKAIETSNNIKQRPMKALKKS